MPLITLFLIVLLNKTEIMKTYKTNIWMNLALGATFIFNCYMLYVALDGFMNLI